MRKQPLHSLTSALINGMIHCQHQQFHQVLQTAGVRMQTANTCRRSPTKRRKKVSYSNHRFTKTGSSKQTVRCQVPNHATKKLSRPSLSSPLFQRKIVQACCAMNLRWDFALCSPKSWQAHSVGTLIRNAFSPSVHLPGQTLARHEWVAPIARHDHFPVVAILVKSGWWRFPHTYAVYVSWLGSADTARINPKRGRANDRTVWVIGKHYHHVEAFCTSINGHVFCVDGFCWLFTFCRMFLYSDPHQSRTVAHIVECCLFYVQCWSTFLSRQVVKNQMINTMQHVERSLLVRSLECTENEYAKQPSQRIIIIIPS